MSEPGAGDKIGMLEAEITQLAQTIDEYRHVMGIVEHFAATWRELMIEAPDTYTCTYTCGEASAAVELYLALGDTSAARAILAAHAAYDTDGDDHWRGGGATT